MNIEALISENELIAIISTRFNVDDDYTVEKIGKMMAAWSSAQNLPPGTVFMLSTDYWVRFKEEMRLLICTNDKKYKDVRRKLSRTGRESQTVILTTISAAV